MNRLKKISAVNHRILRSFYRFHHSRMLPQNPHADHHYVVSSFSYSGDTGHGSDPHSLDAADTILAGMDDYFHSRSPENFRCFHSRSHCHGDDSRSCHDFHRIPDGRC